MGNQHSNNPAAEPILENKVLTRLHRAKRRFRLMIAAEVEDEVLLGCYLRMRDAREELKKMNDNTLHISLQVFNANVLSEEECYRQLWFRKKDIGNLVQLCR